MRSPKAMNQMQTPAMMKGFNLGRMKRTTRPQIVPVMTEVKE
jgi:hypothetical protein